VSKLWRNRYYGFYWYDCDVRFSISRGATSIYVDVGHLAVRALPWVWALAGLAVIVIVGVML
jgi:hypothetical protein